MLTEKAKYKAKILIFWEKHGLEATLDAFLVKRSTLFEWKKILRDNNGKLESLNEKSRCPKNKRKTNWNTKIIDFIEYLRNTYPKIGKDKIKPLLDEYCRNTNIKSVSISTIGRIIVYLKQKNKIPTYKKISFNAKTERFFEKSIKKQKKIRRKDYKPEVPGDLLQIDTIVKFINGIKRYIITAIDLRSDFAFA
ncbi:MAG: hypothetical protein ACPL3E_00995, partial [Minisyncoccia bacterium]